jgi:hypothetical protein
MLASLFFVFFCVVVVPPLIQNPDVVGALAAGFVNPDSSGYSADAIVCWFILAVWVVFEVQRYSVKGGLYCLLLGLVPGVAVGLAAYLFLRPRQVSEASSDA